MGGDEDVVAGAEIQDLPGQIQGSVALNQQDPLVLDLIVEGGLRAVAADDTLDDQVAVAQELLEGLAGWGWATSVEEVGWGHFKEKPALGRFFSRVCGLTWGAPRGQKPAGFRPLP